MGKIAVLGLGQSLEEYAADSNNYSAAIGVNDIWSRVQTPYVVCVDRLSCFTPERLAVIQACRPMAFYSHLDFDKNVPIWGLRPDFVKIELQPYYPTYVCQLDTPQLPKSHCSPFVAAVIAFKLLHADEVHLYGVDLVNHPNLKPATCERIKLHFANLKRALADVGCGFVVHGRGILCTL
jgi:hypothetical protein